MPIRLSGPTAACRQSMSRLSAAGAALVALSSLTSLDALRAAGLNGAQPRGGGAFRGLISQLTDNAEWLILTAIGLFGTAAAGALIFGVRSAPEWLFRAGLGLLLLLVGVPAVLA
jgi:hypothetical protein